MQLTDLAWRWVPKDDLLFEALFKSNVGLSDTVKSAVMLRLCLGSIRDYAREMAAAESQPSHLIRPTTALPEYGKTEVTDSVMSSESDDDDKQDDGDLCEDAETKSDPNVDGGVGRKRGGQAGGTRARWLPLEERRLKSYMQENKDWPWIAGKLRRTETAVAQHWRMMSQAPGRHIRRRK